MVYINTTGKHNEVWLDKPYATITVECPDCPSTEDAYNSGWTDGSEDGYDKGYQSGRTDGYDDGWGPGYDSGYTDGLEACSGGSCEGVFDSGYTAGEAAQKAKLSALTITSDWGNYTNENGWSSVTVNVPMKKWLEESITENGYYTYDTPYPDYKGYKAARITVNVPDRYNEGYNSGYTDGLNACSGGSCEGIWEAGYDSGFTDGVNSVECSGYTQEDLDAAFASGYSAGLRDCSGYTPATDLTLNVASAITGTGQASVTVTPNDAGTDITYTSSDPSKATIDEDGVITVVGDGDVTFCAIDQITELQNCKTVNVTVDSGITPDTGTSSSTTLDTIYSVTSTTTPTKLVDSQGFVPGIVKVELADQTEITLVRIPNEGSGYTFSATGLESVTYTINQTSEYTGTTYQSLGRELFHNTDQLVSVVVPTHIELIDQGCFFSCGLLSSVTLPNSLKIIGEDAFRGCSSLTSIAIPSSVTYIYSMGLYNSGFTYIAFLGTTPPGLGLTALGSSDFTFPIYVPASAVEAYKSASGWSSYASRIQAIPE